MRRNQILVVGTTTDYIDRIERSYPGRCLFLTDPSHRPDPRWPAPPRGAELVVALDEPAAVRDRLKRHVDDNGVTLTGITCFDCESMALAATLGIWLGLDYPSPAAVATVRNKYATTSNWRRVGIPCPQSALIASAEDLLRFFSGLAGGIVLKPLSGSGSEMVWACRDEAACRDAFEFLRNRLPAHPDARMYAPIQREGVVVDPRRVYLAEELIEGVELSCDFMVDAGAVEVIRLMRKIPAAGEPLGTVSAYVMPAELAAGPALDRLRRQLGAAATEVGLERAICVVDLIDRGGEFVLLEIAPRLAGDCVPALTRASTGMDPLGLALDFAAGSRPVIPAPSAWQRLVAVRLLAARAGQITALGCGRLESDPRIVEVKIGPGIGDLVVLPPASYEHRLLGHAIFRPAAEVAVEQQCAEIAALLDVQIEPLPRAAALVAGR